MLIELIAQTESLEKRSLDRYKWMLFLLLKSAHK